MISTYPIPVRLKEISLPEKVVDELNIKPDDLLVCKVEDGKLVITPIPKDQEWFWSEEWQKGEREAEEDIKAGRTSGPMSAEETIKWLDRDSSGS